MPSPNKQFPFDALISPNSHLAYTIIPILLISNSLEVFLDKLQCSYLILQGIFHTPIICFAWPLRCIFRCVIRMTHSKQATLHTAIVHRIAGLIPISNFLLIITFRVSAIFGMTLYAIITFPNILTPSIYPDLGNQSKHQELHSCALRRFKSPSKQNNLTRILHLTLVFLYYIKLFHNNQVRFLIN